MKKIKRISAALLAMAIACSAMASCGNSDSDSGSGSTGGNTGAAAANDGGETAVAEGEAGGDGVAEADNGAQGDAEGAEAETETEAGDADDEIPADIAAITPDLNYKHNYEFQGYDAFLMFADTEWFWRNMKPEGSVHASDFDENDPGSYGYGVDADIVGDGEYTVALTKDSIRQNNGMINEGSIVDEDNGGYIFPNNGITVFCIDIMGLMKGDMGSGLDDDDNWEMEHDLGGNDLEEGDNHYDVDKIGDYNPGDLKVEVTSIKADGQEVEFDASKIRYGNIEDDNNNYRIEIYNAYGTTAQDAPLDPLSLYFNESLEVTFTIEGLGEVKTFPEVTPFGGDGAAAEDAGDVAEETAEGGETAEGEEKAAE